MAETNVFSEFETAFISQVSNFSVAASKNLITSLIPIVTTGLLIYLIVYGWLIASGRIRGSLGGAVMMAVKIELVLLLGLNAGNFAAYVIPTVDDVQNILLQAASGALGKDLKTPWSALDQLWSSFIEAWGQVENMLTGLSWIDAATTILALFVLGLVMAIICVLFTFSAAGILLINKVALIVVLGFGPLFLCTLLFPPIKSWFDSWLKSLMTFTMTLVMTATVIALFSMVFGSSLNEINNLVEEQNLPLIDLAKPVLIFSVLALIGATFVKQIPTITSALTGGMNMSSVGLGQMLGGVGKTAGAVSGGALVGAGASLGNESLSKAGRAMIGSQGLGAAGALPMSAISFAGAGAIRLASELKSDARQSAVNFAREGRSGLDHPAQPGSAQAYFDSQQAQATSNAKVAEEMVKAKKGKETNA